MNSPIASFIEQQGFLMLDGGLATELERRGNDLNDKLWSAKMLINNDQEICKVHLSYLEAGADCISSATYQASIPGFIAHGISKSKAKALIKKAVDIANEASQFIYNDLGKHSEETFDPDIFFNIGLDDIGCPANGSREKAMKC